MIRKLPRHILRASKFSLMGVCIQCLFVGDLWALGPNAGPIGVVTEVPLSVADVNVFQRSVTGRVTDGENNEGLPGVNVIVKGTTTGTVTDFDGNFRLDVPSSEAVLVFSSIGYATQEITVGQNSIINVILAPDVLALSEVLIVCYG